MTASRSLTPEVWRVQNLIDDGVLEINDGYRVRNVELGPQGIPFVRGGDIGDGTISTSVVDHIRPVLSSRVVSKMTRAGDVAFISKGTVGRVGRVRDGQPPFVFAPQVCYWRSLDHDRLDPTYLFYALRSQDFYAHLDAVRTHGSMVADYVSLTDQKRFTLPLPEITAQRRIADILGSLDDKIELNRRMNATLESLARRLFKSWFVDFDPVHAKAAVRRQHPKWDNDRVSREALPKLDPKIAELFPDEFEESTLGPIPKGWKVCPLSDRLQILSGGTPKTSEPSYWDGDIPWYSVKDAPSETDLWVIDTERHITVLGVENSVTQLLPRGTTIISARGTVGKLALVATPMAMNQSCYGIRGVEDHSGFFTYYALRHAVLELQQRSHGTVFDTITRHTFETLDCISPPQNLIRSFESAAEPLLNHICASLQESHYLATTRDRLLPQLLSGGAPCTGAEE